MTSSNAASVQIVLQVVLGRSKAAFCSVIEFDRVGEGAVGGPRRRQEEQEQKSHFVSENGPLTPHICPCLQAGENELRLFVISHSSLSDLVPAGILISTGPKNSVG